MVGTRQAARSILVALTLAVATLAAGAFPATADEPAGFGYFHTYAEMEAVIDAAVADHPDIAQKFSIGQSYHGREIWAIKLTGDVAAGNQGRPEVLIDGMIHGRERAAGELAIYMIQVLTGKYGQTTNLGRRVTAMLNTRVVYIVPMVNADGAVYDFKNGTLHSWRKNRQPIPGSSEVGIDLNRNFGFRWSCCGGSSGNPASDTYRGPSPWYAPEDVAYRDFIKSRVVDGEQRITAILSLHSAGRLVLWPYGYTRVDVPSTMTADDHTAFVALGNGMANRNGYVPQQSSDLYITDGDQNDWAYHAQRIFALTLEMKKGAVRRYYPSKSELAADLARNKLAVLWFLGQADCPYRAGGLDNVYCAAPSAAELASASIVRQSIKRAE
jgi:carboxypeptidase T